MNLEYIKDYRKHLLKTDDFNKDMENSKAIFESLSDRYKVSQTYGHSIRDLYILGFEYPDMQYIIPEYQRELVWTDGQKGALILSISKGFPIGDFLIAVNNSGSDFYVIDGQQRINTIREFINGEFSIEIRGCDLFWKDLSFKDKYSFLSYRTTTNVITNIEVKEQAKIYIAMNSFGTEHTKEELDILSKKEFLYL